MDESGQKDCTGLIAQSHCREEPASFSAAAAAAGKELQHINTFATSKVPCVKLSSRHTVSSQTVELICSTEQWSFGPALVSSGQVMTPDQKDHFLQNTFYLDD